MTTMTVTAAGVCTHRPGRKTKSEVEGTAGPQAAHDNEDALMVCAYTGGRRGAGANPFLPFFFDAADFCFSARAAEKRTSAREHERVNFEAGPFRC
ncbi:hypothetical protein MTO96_004252 [Rhipicephalus appendiculatus]